MNKDKSGNKRNRRNPTNTQIHEDTHEKELREGDVMELGPVTTEQGGLFERMRTRITPPEVLKLTFDKAVLKRCAINSERGVEDVLPPEVDAATFDADVQRILQLDGDEAIRFHKEVMDARMERDAESGGVFVNPDRASGFGPDVIGFAYDIISGKWGATNEMGLHAYCARHLDMTIRFEDLKAETEIISGFIFQLASTRTPVMTPSGYFYKSPALVRKAFENMWSWRKFIPITAVKVAPRRHLYRQLFTPEYAEQACQEMP